ncbi:ABC transporter permease [Stieleria sp. TO1_6]|uniref:FtsX-like permease family protein n=1 Tax=Stieleria tagensis TaxID=2956795 RepID=UPI00209B0D39|nr:ABC transporter permease [Stieleria tagensis]MCO8123592.1 ABC transporter permease [Stieleria tagensis]
MKVLKLALAFLRERKTRVLLTTIATSAAVCMVIWVSSSYEALQKTYDDYANLALGRYELAIAPISGDAAEVVPAEVLQPLRDDPAVVAVEPMWANRFGIKSVSVTNKSHTDDVPVARVDQTADLGPGSGPRGQLPSLLFLATDSTTPAFDIAHGHWINGDSATENQVVLRSDVAKRRQIQVNDEIIVEFPRPSSSGETEMKLQVVGLADAPSLTGAEAVGISMLTPSSGEAFISVPLAEHISGETARISLLGLAIDPQADITQFRFGWAPRLSNYSTPLQFQEAFEIEEALDQASAAANVRLQSFAATGVAMLVAMLVIFGSLSMGVTERIRQYAVLRAVVLTRRQVGCLIVVESLVLGTTGLVVGIASGWTLLALVELSFSKLLHHGLGFGTRSLSLAAITAFGGALLAAIIPTYRASRVKPVDAMAPRGQAAAEASLSWRSVALGILLIATGPLLTFVFPPSENQIWLALVVGFACMATGFVVLAPSLVFVVDRYSSPSLARAFGIDPKLLASQITSNLWRTVGASTAMAFGLGLFVGIHVWGATMLKAFVPGSWAPDAMIVLKPGMPPDRITELAMHEQVDSDRCLPLVVEQPRLVDDLTSSADRASVTRQDNVVIVGLDPTGAFAGDRPLLQLDWVAGSATEAAEKMKRGHACVVPDHFLRETGLGLGDTIALDPPRNAGNPVIYTIVGAVRLPGWHWQTKMTGLRPRTHRAAALVFADYESVASDFDLPAASHVWFSYSKPNTDVASIEAAADSMLKSLPAMEGAQASARVVPVQGIRDQLTGSARRWIWIISFVPLITLLIACLGVLNVMLASVRARRWEFGVLRSIGFTSSDLARAILVEGLFIALIAGILSVGFGILSGWCGAGLAQYTSFFGGLHPPMVVPWLPIGCGFLLVLLLGILCAAWPALTIHRSRPMSLLQSGDPS